MIAVILIASLVIPVNAVSWTVVNPADHITETRREDGIDYVSYDFNTSPLINYSLSGYPDADLVGSAYSSVSLEIDHTYRLPLKLKVYPLGKVYSPGYGLTSPYSGQIAIDASDFKPNAALTVNANIYLHLDFFYTSAVWASRSDVVGGSIQAVFYEYDANGNYLSKISDLYSFQLVLSPQDGTATVQLPYQKTLSLSSMNGGTRYIVPYFSVGMSAPQDVDDIDLRQVDFSSEAFYISTQTDMLLKDSMTLEAIEKQLEDLNDKTDSTNEKLDDLNDQLGDLNDKADTVISGTPGMQQNADDASNFAQDQYEELNRVEELEKEYLDDYEASSDVLNDKVSLFVDGVGFTQLTALVTPIMNWNYSGLIMLLVIAFINMSVIMFGR